MLNPQNSGFGERIACCVPYQSRANFSLFATIPVSVPRIV